jgi:RNA polymerase sigma-70 factor (ECF subfamily)
VQEPVVDPQGEFIRLLLRHERQIYGYIRTLIPNRADAEDVLQNVSTVLWKKFGQFQPGSNFLAWALQVAWHEVQSFRRRQRQEHLRFSTELVETLSAVAFDECKNFSELEAALIHCTAKLRPEARELLARRYEGRTSVGAIAEEMRRPVQTVYSMLKRIRVTVYQCIQRTMTAGGRP